MNNADIDKEINNLQEKIHKLEELKILNKKTSVESNLDTIDGLLTDMEKNPSVHCAALSTYECFEYIYYALKNLNDRVKKLEETN